MRHPEAEHDALLLYRAPDARRRICSAALQGSRSSKQSWIALRCSGADPSASRKPCRNTLQFAWLASGWRVAGVRWTLSVRSLRQDLTHIGKFLLTASRAKE